MRIIPAIDIIDGKCVRLTKGDYNQKTIYSEDPLEIAKMFEDHGVHYLHVVDLDGAKAHQIINYKVLETLASKTNLNIDFGGGIKTITDVNRAFEAGAKQVTVGSVAAKEPALMMEWLEIFGGEKLILGADCKARRIATNGWLEQSSLDILAFLQDYEQKGMRYSVVTDIDKDGMLAGPSFSLYDEILKQTNLCLIASGGVTTCDDVVQLKQLGCEGVIIGKALYEGRINLKELMELC